MKKIKINHLHEICKESLIDILCVDETKQDSSYTDPQFQINDYQFPPFRRDRNKYGGGKILFIRQGLITRLPNFETKVSETIRVELTVSKKKWCILSGYRPPQNNNLKTIFEEINLSLSTIVNEYDNIMLTGDLNLNMKSKNSSYYSNFTFDLANLIKAVTCFKSSNQTSIDVILTNWPRSFQKITTWLSDCHKMILTFFRFYFSRLPC